MTEGEVKKLLKKEGLVLSKFLKWMGEGQTMGVDEEGNLLYYTHDVERWIAHKKQGRPLIWD